MSFSESHFKCLEPYIKKRNKKCTSRIATLKQHILPTQLNSRTVEKKKSMCLQYHQFKKTKETKMSTWAATTFKRQNGKNICHCGFKQGSMVYQLHTRPET